MLLQRVTRRCDMAARPWRVLCFIASVFVSCAALASDSGASLGSAAKNGSVDTLTIGAPSAGGTSREILVPVTLNVHSCKPNLILFKMVYDPKVLTFRAVERGPAAVAAGKYAEAYESEPGTVGFIVWALNLDAIDTGLVLTAVFDRVSLGTELEQIFISGVNASMADESSNAVAVRMIYFAPSSVTVSADPEGVLVEWSEVVGANRYWVYRSESEDPETANTISYSLGASTLSFVDDSVPTDITEDPEYCQNLFYWVAAENEDGDDGTLSEPAGWNPGAPAAPETVAVVSISWEGVLVEWSAVDNAGRYQVYRGTSDDPNEAEPISEWILASSVSYLDGEVIRGSCTLGCAETCQTYYYWVRSESESGCEGTFSPVAVGQGLSLTSSKALPSAASVVPGTGLGRESFGDILLLGVAAAGLLAGRRLVSSRRDVRPR
jgi:hypothetical protein